MKLESLARMNGIESGGAHNALFDANLTKLVLEKIYKEQNITWKSAMLTGSREEVEKFSRNELMFTLSEYFYGRSQNFILSRLYILSTCCTLFINGSKHLILDLIQRIILIFH